MNNLNISMTWEDLCSEGLALDIIELKGFDEHGAYNIPEDELIYLTVNQAKRFGLLEEEVED